MKVLKATLAQKQALEGTYLNNCVLKFVEDKNGNWVVNTKVIENGQFLEIRAELQALPLIDFEPKITETI
jgi:hypothetical protein